MVPPTRHLAFSRMSSSSSAVLYSESTVAQRDDLLTRRSSSDGDFSYCNPSIGNEMEDIGIPASHFSFPSCPLANVQPGKMQIDRPEGRIARRSYSALLKFEMLGGDDLVSAIKRSLSI